MPKPSRKAAIKHILCPTDLSGKSQKTLGLATRLSEAVGAELTACHCSPANWFSSTAKQLSPEGAAEIKGRITEQIVACKSPGSELPWRASVIANSFDAARDIVNLARETSVDLIVMKARPSVLSAFKFGSIVERVVSRASCPVLLLPSRFVADRDPATEGLAFRKVLFDYDFSQATDRLFGLVNGLTIELNAELHVLSVLEHPRASVEVEVVKPSRTRLQTAIRGKLNNAIEAEGRASSGVYTAVEWGNHAETVLQYVAAHDIDLICTTLPPPHFYLESFYSTYLGALLRGARCPILVAQSV
jgi:nucleotide-binding universal stress UspA family protein